MLRLLALIGVVGISFSAIFVRLADVSPSTAAVFRGAYALPLLLALWLVVRRRDPRSRRMRWLAFAAGVALALDLTVWHRSIALIGAGLSTVLANTQVVFVGVLAWILHRERPTGTAFLMVPVVFAGVVLIAGVGSAEAYGENPPLGALFGTLAGLAYSAYLLAFRASNRVLAHPAGPLLDATAGMTLGALLFSVTDPGMSLVPHWPAHGWLLTLAVVAQVVGWLLIAIAMPRLAALETSVLLLLQPACTVLWGVLVFDEELSGAQWAGAGLVLAGIGTLSLRGSVRAPPPSPPPASPPMSESSAS